MSAQWRDRSASATRADEVPPQVLQTPDGLDDYQRQKWEQLVAACGAATVLRYTLPIDAAAFRVRTAIKADAVIPLAVARREEAVLRAERAVVATRLIASCLTASVGRPLNPNSRWAVEFLRDVNGEIPAALAICAACETVFRPRTSATLCDPCGHRPQHPRGTVEPHEDGFVIVDYENRRRYVRACRGCGDVLVATRADTRYHGKRTQPASTSTCRSRSHRGDQPPAPDYELLEKLARGISTATMGADPRGFLVGHDSDGTPCFSGMTPRYGR